MKKEAFETLQQIENTWWHYGRISAVRRALKKSGHQREEGEVLDIGCGFGGMFEFLKEFGDVFGVEPNTQAQSVARTRGYQSVVGDISEIEGPFSIIGAFDVIEHIEDDEKILMTIHSLLKKEGVFLATVPAFPFLFSNHDEEHMHFRRYRKKEFVRLLEDAGFAVAYVGYWNRTLFPVAACMRLFGRSGEGGLTPPGFIDKMMRGLMFLEAKTGFPFLLPGLSIVVVATRER